MRLCGILLVPLCVVTLSQGLWGASATDLLAKAQEAEQRVSFRGIKLATVRVRDSYTSSKLKVIHKSPNRTRTEYYSPDAVKGIIIVELGSRIYKYLPKEDLWEPAHECPALPPAGIQAQAFRNYDLRVIGTEKVAGRVAYVVQAVPRYADELIHRVWVDKYVHLILATQVETPHGEVVSSSKYVSMQINPPDLPVSLFKVVGKVKEIPDHHAVTFRLVRPTFVPRGYRLVATSTMMIRGRCCAHLQFSNGVNTISLFEHTSSADAPPRPVKSGIAQVLTWAKHGIEFTLVGEVPMSELQKMADSTVN